MEFTLDNRFSAGTQQLINDFKMPLAGAAVTLLLIVTWAIWSLWPTQSAAQLDIVEVIETPIPDTLVIDAPAARSLGAAVLVAAKQITVRGVVHLPTDRVLVANDIVFEPASRLMVPKGRITMIAPRISGAVVDVAGHDGLDGLRPGAAGGDGETAGIALIAAAAFTDTQVLARGGTGGNGARGGTGTAGRNGYCGPRSFGLAKRGGAGGAGGAGGNGGSGGVVALLYQDTPAHADAAEGSAGEPGRGGNGGRGGAGCKGLRGEQPNQQAGNEGPTGRSGARGAAGSIDSRQIYFSAVIDAFEDWLEYDNSNPNALRDRLLAIPERDPS
jgi:hypothetical protein